MKSHPYMKFPDTAFWKRSVAKILISDVDPVGAFPFRIGKHDRVATAGSCFAQHISRKLREMGFNFYVTESAHPLVASRAALDGYGIYSARYGNIYTARQLVQLFKRAYGKYHPADDVWMNDENAYIDPFRPTIQENGFSTKEELVRDRDQHFECVRECFEGLDFFVFTLGLTEYWSSTTDGAVYPICPGVTGGNFNDENYEFKTFSVSDVVDDMEEFVELLQAVNPKARIILTVSPVPLAATASGKHVLTATMLSKSILRAAAEEVCVRHENVAYFPSYEVIVGSYTRGMYFSEDLRGVTEAGVNHVMSLFVKHGVDGAKSSFDAESSSLASEIEANQIFISDMKEMIDVMCDESSMDPENAS